MMLPPRDRVFDLLQIVGPEGLPWSSRDVSDEIVHGVIGSEIHWSHTLNFEIILGLERLLDFLSFLAPPGGLPIKRPGRLLFCGIDPRRDEPYIRTYGFRT